MQPLRPRPVVAAIVVSALTIVIIGGVLLTATSLGCGPAQKLGLKGVLSHCNVSGPLTAAITTPRAKGGFFPSPIPTKFPPYSPPASEPYAPPVSGPTPPDNQPASGAYPPFTPPASGPGGASVPALSLNCRLPVYVGPSGSGGFIVYPGDTFIADPTSAVTLPSPSPGSPTLPSPVSPGYGQPGYSGLSYDYAYSRWLPVPYTAVSPDGSRYAHAAANGIYVENLATGVETEVGEGRSWTVVDVQPQGVLATVVNQAGLWILPYTGSATEITTSGFWQAANADYAYGTPTSAVPQGVANTIIRVDLKSGAIADWFTRQGAQSSVVGFDTHNNALIYVNYFTNPGGAEVWLTIGPSKASPMFGSPEGLSFQGPPVADSHGIWFPAYFSQQFNPTSSPGIVLLVPSSGLYWMSSIGAQLAGGCI